MDQNKSEKLLYSWLQMAMGVRAGRIVNHLSFNEIVVCGLLLQRQEAGLEASLTATEICDYTHLLKSQINRVLTSLEKNGYICRFRSKADKRKIHIILTEAGCDQYRKAHEEVMDFVNHIYRELGEEKTDQLINSFDEAMRAADTYEFKEWR